MRTIITRTYKSGAKTRDDRVFADLDAFTTYCLDDMGIKNATMVDIEESWLHLYAGGTLDQPFDEEIECSWTMVPVCIDCGMEAELFPPRNNGERTPGKRCAPCANGELVVRRYFDPTDHWIIWTNDENADFDTNGNADMRMRATMDPVQRMDEHGDEEPGYTFTYWLWFEGKNEAGEWEHIDDRRGITVSDSALLMEIYPDEWDLTTDQTYAQFKERRNRPAPKRVWKPVTLKVATITDIGPMESRFRVTKPADLQRYMSALGYGMDDTRAEMALGLMDEPGNTFHFCGAVINRAD